MSTMISNSDFDVFEMSVADVVNRKDLLWMYVDYIVKNKEFNVSGDEIKDFCYAICTADELFGTNPQALSANKFYYSNKGYLDALSSHQSSDVEVTTSGYSELPTVQNARVIADAITLGLQHSGYWKENFWYCCEGSEVVLKNSDLGNSFKVLECPTNLVSDNAEMAKVESRLRMIKRAIMDSDEIKYGIDVNEEVCYVASASKSLAVANIKAKYKGLRVTSIGRYAFENCTSLTSVTIPDSVTYIGKYAFKGCTSLTSVTIPNSVTHIDKGAFEDCKSLTAVTIPDSVKSIGNEAFQGCTSLTEVTIPSSVIDIGDLAFYKCTSLTAVTIPNSVTSIGSGAFWCCTSLTTVTIPNSVKDIGVWAFEDCTSLTSVTIPNSVTSIGRRTFAGCDSLTAVTIPDSMRSIGEEAFWHCNSLTTVTVPNSVIGIGDRAFEGCTSLTAVTILGSWTSIGEGVFEGCTSLTTVTLPGRSRGISERVFAHCESLTTVTISNSVESIGNKAFEGCTSLTTVTIPDSVTSIGEMAFGYVLDSEGEQGKRVSDFTIQGYRGTEAETYANKNEFKFVALDSAVSGTNSMAVKEFLRLARCEKLLFNFTEDAVRSISLSKLNYTQSDLQDALFRYIPKLEVPVSIVENLTEEARNFVSKYFVCKDDITDSSFTQEKISDYVTFCHMGFMQVFAEMVERSYRQHGGAVAGAVGMLLTQSGFPCGYYFKRDSSILLPKADTSNAVSGLIGALFNSDSEKSSNKYFIETLLFAYANILCSNKPSLAEVKEMFK